MSRHATAPDAAAIAAATARRDEHLRAVIAHHFSPETGTPFWLDRARQWGVDPRETIRTFDDLKSLPRFEDDWLRDEPPERFAPRAYAGRPFKIFETGGTTGMPKQRPSWDDHLTDYTRFSETLGDAHFPRGAAWLMVGPTGPRRLRLSIEHLANLRGGPCYFVDLDPRWVKRVLGKGDALAARAYMDHVVDQALTILAHRRIACLFTTPKILEAMGARVDLAAAGVRGVFCGGTSMTPQVVRFLVEEVLGEAIAFRPTYGNTLMGLAVSRPLSADDGYRLTYYAPEPRAVLRVVDGDDPDRGLVDYDAWGRVELTTLTHELFMPRFLERDEAVRRAPWGDFAWDGVGEVRPFGAIAGAVVEGVY